MSSVVNKMASQHKPSIREQMAQAKKNEEIRKQEEEAAKTLYDVETMSICAQELENVNRDYATMPIPYTLIQPEQWELLVQLVGAIPPAIEALPEYAKKIGGALDKMSERRSAESQRENDEALRSNTDRMLQKYSDTIARFDALEKALLDDKKQRHRTWWMQTLLLLAVLVLIIIRI